MIAIPRASSVSAAFIVYSLMMFSLAPQSLAGVLLTVVLVGCSGMKPDVAEPTPNVSAAALSLPSLTWQNRLRGLSAPSGWSVTPCDNPALLCVNAGQDQVGTVEMMRYPLAEFDADLAANADRDAILDAWVDDHYATLRADRTGADPRLVVLTRPAEVARVGNLSARRYQLTIRRNDTLSERSLGYVATDGMSLYLITTGVINGDPTSPFSSDAALREFEPHLAAMVANLNF